MLYTLLSLGDLVMNKTDRFVLSKNYNELVFVQTPPK